MSESEHGAVEPASLQDRGRRVLTAMYSAMRALRFYPLDNEVVQNALADLRVAVGAVFEEDGVLELQLVGNFFFLNEERLRVDLRNYSTFGSVAQIFRGHELGEIRAHAGGGAGEWATLLHLLMRTPESDLPFEAFASALRDAGVSIEVKETIEEDVVQSDDEAVEGARQTYTRSVQTAREILTDVRLGRAVNVRKVKRAVQGIVDQVITNEPSILAMTHLREFDDYTFTHSVNVCILSVVIGQRLGLGRNELYDLGLGALFHDLGKTRIPIEVLNKTGKLNDNDWRLLKEHPADGLLMLFGVHGFRDLPYRQMLIAYEHHMKVDLTGYPPNKRDRAIGLYSRIVAVADGFDAATSVRSYQYRPLSATDVLKGMLESPTRGFDPIVVKALVTATGVYPVGTLVILSTFELAVVTRANPDPARLHQPEVKVVSDPMGMPLPDPVVVRLDQIDPRTGEARRSIIKTADPKRYGVDVAEYVT